MKKAAVTLEGGHSGVIAVAHAAAKAIALDGSAKHALFRDLWVLHQRRREFAGWQKEATARGINLWQAVWGVLLGMGMLAALTAAVMFGPAGRKNASISAEQAASVALPAAQIGIVLICRGAPPSGARNACRTLWKRVHVGGRIGGCCSLWFQDRVGRSR
ncbi:hypothetical protein [Arthrobacter sp. M2012083]|uniref:hypothetical protein n=1 Tax=Arthrobacter sp. M2012083 TaxID=1197706 RepID=UPI000308DC11|nr:hypothetical protein [Arthrobacter sp. M2012083]